MCYLIIAITWRSYPAEGGISPFLTLIIFVEEALGRRKNFDVISLVIKHWNILSRVLLAFLSFFFCFCLFCAPVMTNLDNKKSTSTKMLLELYIPFPNCSLPYRRGTVIQIITTHYLLARSRVGVVVRALAFHQCVPGSIPGPAVIRGLSLLLLNSIPRGFFPGSPVFPSHQKPTFEFVLLWFNLISAPPHKLQL